MHTGAIARSTDLPAVLGQLPSLTNPTGAQPLPVGVERRGTLEATGVRLDGKELFKIASLAVYNRSEPGSQIPVEIRAKQIEANLDQLIVYNRGSGDVMLDPKTLEVSIEQLNGQPVLFVKDATLTEAKVLLTVTDTDAQFHSTTQDRLANRWQEILESELRQALELRQPEALRQQKSELVRILAATVLSTVLLGGVWTFLKWRKLWLEQQQEAERIAAHTESILAVGMPAVGMPAVEMTNIEMTNVETPPMETTVPQPRLRLFQGVRDYLGLQRRLQIVRLFKWVTLWAIAFVWLVGIAYSLNLFPQTRQFANRVIAIPIVILIAWFLTGLINRLANLVIDRFIESRGEDQSLTDANLQRVATLANVIKGLKRVLVYSLSILWILQWLHLAPASVLAVGALVALAVSFAAQNLVKDLVNGFLILLEDQFRIGDLIKVGTTSGLVTNLNLRITQLRSDDGNLITIPNNLIAQVENMSRTWARADFRVEVAYDTDVDHALAVVRETVDCMAQEPEWKALIFDTQELFGVEQISHTGIVIRIWIKTAPLKQWPTARELRRRLKIAFDRHNIQIGIPQQMVLEHTSDMLDPVEQAQEIE
jgi:small-conductance mechanosensitive channel